MSAAELRSQIIRHLSSVEDEGMLHEIPLILTKAQETYQNVPLSAAEQDAVAKGLKDLEEDRLFSSQAADNMIQEWLKR